jgi:hypothetical protein
MNTTQAIRHRYDLRLPAPGIVAVPGYPVLAKSVPAGFPSPAADYFEDRLSLDEHLIEHREANRTCVHAYRRSDALVHAYVPPEHPSLRLCCD